MSENKNIKYAMIGGAALVGAAVLYYLTAGGSGDKAADEATNAALNEANEKMEEDLEQIGEIELEEGHIKFEQFLKIFEICSYHGKTLFSEQKKNFIARRRQALKDGDET